METCLLLLNIGEYSLRGCLKDLYSFPNIIAVLKVRSIQFEYLTTVPNALLFLSSHQLNEETKAKEYTLHAINGNNIYYDCNLFVAALIPSDISHSYADTSDFTCYHCIFLLRLYKEKMRYHKG